MSSLDTSGPGHALASSPPPSSLRTAIEDKSRQAGLGTAFITPEWWAKVASLNRVDGIPPHTILEAFDRCVASGPGKVAFFAEDFPKYRYPEKQGTGWEPFYPDPEWEALKRMKNDPTVDEQIRKIAATVPWRRKT